MEDAVYGFEGRDDVQCSVFGQFLRFLSSLIVQNLYYVLERKMLQDTPELELGLKFPEGIKEKGIMSLSPQ